MVFKAILVAELVFLFVSLPSAVICDCPNDLPARKSDVDLTQLKGMWYEYGASTRDFQYLFADAGCVPVYFHEVTKPPLQYIYYKNISNVDTMSTIATFHGSSGEYRITYMLAKEYLKGSFLVLDTDYQCWAVVYACAKSKPVYVSILQRSVDGKKCFNDETGKHVEPALNKVGLKLADMDMNNAGDNCEYTPDPSELM